MDSEIQFKPWQKKGRPKKILAIRYQAMGDVVITLPYLNDFKKQFPDVELHFLTTSETGGVPKSLTLFNKVIVIDGGRNAKLQFLFTLSKVPFLLWQRYDVVMDLQNNRISRTVRKILKPEAWCEFDRFSSRSAGDRNRLTIESLGLTKVNLNTSFAQKIDEQRTNETLLSNGWRQNHSLVIFNPAGAFETRHWPLSNYVNLYHLLKKNNTNTQFLVIGLKSRLGQSVDYLRDQLKEDLIDLTDQTSVEEAFALVKRARLMITEDSGLMHMAWVQRVPTLAIFGSTRHDWSSPQGTWSVCLNSSDLACGNCLLEKCIHGDNRCLTRHTPEIVFEKALELLKQ